MFLSVIGSKAYKLLGSLIAPAKPVSSENGDPGSPFSYEIRDLGPQFPNILGTPGSPISYDIRDPSMTPMKFFFVLLNFAITMQ